MQNLSLDHNNANLKNNMIIDNTTKGQPKQKLIINDDGI